MVINVDFDGTVVKFAYPEIGADVGAVPVLKRLVAEGHQLILFTMRGNKRVGDTRDTLAEAVNWFKEHGIPLYGIQTNPTQAKWTDSPKSHAQLMIDDAAIGCPLLQEYTTIGVAGSTEMKQMPVGRPFVNWEKIEDGLEKQGILTPKTKENGKQTTDNV